MEMTRALSSYPGFKFSPTEEELVLFYLRRKIEGFQKCVDIIPEIDITKHDPWDLPEKSIIPSNDEWYFFSARGRKYPKGLQSKRATDSGYWKATGKERNVKSGTRIVGTKRTLVFHKGRAPKGKRTEWIMHEYCMSGTPQESFVVCRIRKNCEFSSSVISPKEIKHTLTGESSTAAVVDDIQQKNVFIGHTQNDVENKDMFQDKDVENKDMFQDKDVENKDMLQGFTPPDICYNPHSVDDIQQKNVFIGHTENDVENKDMFQDKDVENKDMFQDKDVENKDMLQGFTPPDICYNPHSVERFNSDSEYEKKPGSLIFQHSTDSFDYESECDKNAGNLYFQDESCSSPKGFEGVADDYFDNILNDDIFKQDKFSLLSSDLPGKDILNDDFTGFKFEQPDESFPPPILPFQGTAPRRIRLKSRQRIRPKNPLPFHGTAPRRIRMIWQHIDNPVNPVEESGVRDRMYCVVAESADFPRHLITTMSDATMNHRHVMVLVVLGLLVVFLAVLIRHDIHRELISVDEDTSPDKILC